MIFVWVVVGLGEGPVPGHGQVMRLSATAVCAALRATVCRSGVHCMHMNTHMGWPKKVILRTLAVGAALVFALAAESATAASAAPAPLTPHLTSKVPAAGGDGSVANCVVTVWIPVCL